MVEDMSTPLHGAGLVLGAGWQATGCPSGQPHPQPDGDWGGRGEGHRTCGCHNGPGITRITGGLPAVVPWHLFNLTGLHATHACIHSLPGGRLQELLGDVDRAAWSACVAPLGCRPVGGGNPSRLKTVCKEQCRQGTRLRMSWLCFACRKPVTLVINLPGPLPSKAAPGELPASLSPLHTKPAHRR